MENVYAVDDAALRKATGCEKDFACFCNNSTMCKIEDVIENKLFFVQKKKNVICRNYIPYGLTGCCKCPVRQELYRKYNI